MPSSQLVSGLWPSKGRSTMQASRAAKNVEAICRFRLRRSLRLDDRIVLALLLAMRCGEGESLAGMVLPVDVVLEVGTVEVDVAQIAGTVPFGLIVEVRRRRIAALATGGDSLCAYFFSELDHGDEAVAAGAVPFLCPWVGARSERGK